MQLAEMQVERDALMQEKEALVARLTQIQPLPAPEAGDTIEVTMMLPDEWEHGQTVPVDLPSGETYYATPPENSEPGAAVTIRITVPASELAPGDPSDPNPPGDSVLAVLAGLATAVMEAIHQREHVAHDALSTEVDDLEPPDPARVEAIVRSMELHTLSPEEVLASL